MSEDKLKDDSGGKTNWAEKLTELLAHYDDKYFQKGNITMRHDCWFMLMTISNVVMVEEIKKLREDMKSFGKADKPKKKTGIRRDLKL